MRLIVKKRVLDDMADPERKLKEGFRIAAQLTGKRKKSELIRLAIWALIERESARRLIAMGGWTRDRALEHAASRLGIAA